MKTDLLRGTREKLRTGIIDKTMTHETRIAELERTPTTGSVQVERQIVSAIGGGGGGSVAISYATTAEIADVTTTEAAGTSSLVARGDHVHAHSQLATGDLHQDYILAAGTRALSGDWSAGDARTITVGAYVAGYASDLTRLAIRVYGGAHFAIKSPNYVAIGNQGDGVIVDQTIDDVGQPDSKALYGRMYLTANTGTNTHIHNAVNAYLSVSSFGATWSAESAALSAVAAVANADGGTLANVAAAQFYASNAGVDGTVTTIRLAHFKTTTGAGTTTFGTLKGIDIDNLGTGITTLAVGIEIAAITGASTNIGIRNASSMRQVGDVTLGVDAASSSAWLNAAGTGTVDASTHRRSYYDTSDITITENRSSYDYYLNAIDPNIDVSATKTSTSPVALLALQGWIAYDLTGTFSHFVSMLIKPTYLAASGTITKWTGLWIAPATAGNASLEVGIRNDLTSRLVGAVTIGADAAVASGLILDVTGNVGIQNAGELRLYEPVASGTNYTAFKAQAQAGNVTYTLPAADATVSGYVLSSNAAGTLSWVAQSGGGAHNLDDATNHADTAIGTAAQGDILYVNATPKWTNLPAGTSGYFLKTQGAGANPVWAAVSGGSLDGAYDYPTAGAGRVITADGATPDVEINGGAAVASTTPVFDVHGRTTLWGRHNGSDSSTRCALEISGYMGISSTDPYDGNQNDLIIGTLTSTVPNAYGDAKVLHATLYLNITTGASSQEHGAVAGAVAIGADSSSDMTGMPAGGRFTAIIGGNTTISAMAGVKSFISGSIAGTHTGTLTAGYIYYADDVHTIETNTITSQVAWKMPNLTGATNNWGAQWGTAAQGSYINHKVKLGDTTEATAGYILDVAGNTKFTGTIEVSSTSDFSGLVTVKGATAVRFNNSGNTFYSEAKAGAAVHNQQLVLPIDIPATGEVLKIDSVTGTNPYVIALKWAADDTGSGALPISANTQLSGGAYHLYIDTASSGIHFYDSRKLLFGTGTGIGTGDAEIYYNGTDLIIEPNAIGTGGVKVLGTMALGTASVTNTILISGTLTTDNDSFSGVSAVLNYSNTVSGGFVLSNANQYQLNIQNVTAGSSVAPTAMYLEFNYKNTISNSATLGGNGLVIYFNNESSYGLASQVGIQISLVADGTGSSDVAKAIFIADPSPVGTTGDIVYGLHMDNFDGSTSPTRWPIYYGDAGTPYWTLNHNAEMAMRVQGTNPTSVTANTVLQYGRNHTLGNTMWMRDENGRESSPTFRGRFIAPMPLNITSTTSSGVTLANTSTGYVGLVNFPTPISVTQIRMRLTTIAVGGTPVIRIAVYDERGQNKLIDVVTTAALTGGSARNIDTAVSPAVMLPPGNYYICIGLQTAASTTQPTIAMWADNTLSAFWNDGGGSEPDLVGTIAFTAGAAPTTFDPTSAITVTASRCPLLAFQGGAL